MRVLMVGTDLSSQGGIASVVRTYNDAYNLDPEGVELKLLRTCHYKEVALFYKIALVVRSLMECAYLLVTFRPHVMHIHSSAYLSFYRKSLFVFMGLLFRRKIIMHLHSSAFDEFFITQNRFVHRYIRMVLSRVSLVIALCEDWRLKLERELGLRNVVVLPNPIVLGAGCEARHFMSSGKLKAVFLAFLIESKGLRDLIEVARVIQRNGDAIKLVVAGKGKLEPVLSKAIEEEGLGDVLEHRGWIDGEAKDALLCEADVFFLPSYNEGMPIAILEAMKFGLPIVSTRIAGIPDEVVEGENGYLLQPGDVDGFYQALRHLGGDVSRLQDMGADSLGKVRQFDVVVIWSRLADIYRGLAKAA